MKTLELTMDGQRYRKFTFPAGELHVRLNQDLIADLQNADELILLARIRSAEQIIELLLLWNAISELINPSAKKTLVLPYLPYSRADRRFVDGDCFGFQTFARLLCGIDATIVALDVHSARSYEMLPALLDVSALPLITEAILSFAQKKQSSAVTILFPDQGARTRYSLPPVVSGVRLDVLHCSKKRDRESGKLTSFEVPEHHEFPQENGQLQPVMIIDDICDGGGTFIGIADSLKDLGLSLALYVTHGIFSKGLSALESRFEQIYSTDSFSDSVGTDHLQILPANPMILQAIKSKESRYHSGQPEKCHFL